MTGCHGDRKSTRLNSSHLVISYAVFCLKKKKKLQIYITSRRVLFPLVSTSCTGCHTIAVTAATAAPVSRYCRLSFSFFFFFFFLMIRPPPISPLFPYTPLFRSFVRNSTLRLFSLALLALALGLVQ